MLVLVIFQRDDRYSFGRLQLVSQIARTIGTDSQIGDRISTTEVGDRRNMKSTEPVLLAKCNHIFAWPFEYQWPKDDVENYAEPFKKKGWIEKDMDIQGMRRKISLC